MAMRYTIRQGDCLSSLAARFGLPVAALWDANPDLKALRKNPNILFPGDVVTVPDAAPRQEDAATGSRHRFRAEAEPVRLRLQLRDRDRAIANERFVLRIGGVAREGTTDAEGRIDVPIPPDATDATLEFRRRTLRLAVGHLDPIETDSGVAGRLRNLGYRSLREFQRDHDLPETGAADAATRSKLVEKHRC
jgi:murein DD-endopeptidase MepM/ murein hydrolase activator NlpD